MHIEIKIEADKFKQVILGGKVLGVKVDANQGLSESQGDFCAAQKYVFQTFTIPPIQE